MGETATSAQTQQNQPTSTYKAHLLTRYILFVKFVQKRKREKQQSASYGGVMCHTLSRLGPGPINWSLSPKNNTT